ncbi:MAG: ABC transporter permease [Chloroflexi bacterium]|nr:MAG: ABC transporter permease [Chloroflexota bacterium]
MNRTLLLKSLRDLRNAWAQTLALIFIVALGIASYIALVSAYRDLGASYQHTYEQLKFADVTFAVQGAPALVATEIEQVSGVTAVAPRLVIDTGFERADGEQIRARIIGVPPDDQPAVNQVLVEDGRYLTSDDIRAVLLESHFAKVYGIKPGDTITPIINGEKITLTVAGVVASPEYLIVSPSRQEIFPSVRTFAVLFMAMPELQTLTGREGEVNEFAVLVDENRDREEVISEITAVLAPYNLETTIRQEDQPSNATLRLDLEGYREIAFLMPGLILLVAAASVYVMLGRLIRAQQPQIGLMKSLGYSNTAVLAHYLTFSLLIGIVGSVLGVIGGLVLTRGITSAYANELGIPLVQTRLHPDLFVSGVLLSLFFAILAGLGPARTSARMAPAIAMRLDPATALSDGHKSWLERWLQLPLSFRLPLRNVFRVRRRSFSTGLGIVFSFILVLMSWGMIDSMNGLLRRNFEEIEQWDVVAVFDTPQTEALVDKVAGWEGVQEVEPLIQLPATIRTDSKDEDVLLTAVSPAQTMHIFQFSDSLTPEAALANDQVVLATTLANKLGLQTGDTVILDTPFGEHKFTLSGVSDEFSGTVAYISLEQAHQIANMPMPVYNGLYLKVDPAKERMIKRDLYHLPGAASVQLKSDTRADIESLMGLFYLFMGIMMAFALGMSFALLFNAMTVNVLERERELATMRAIGTQNGRIVRLLTLENIILWAVTLLPGLISGTWVAQQMGQAFSSELFSLQITISPLSYLLTALGILVTMLLAAIPAIRRVNRLNLAEATKVLT